MVEMILLSIAIGIGNLCESAAHKIKEIKKLNITLPKEENNYMEKYVVEYENKEDEFLEVLMSIDINIINNL